MSVGYFMGIRSSYVESAAAAAENYIDAINRELQSSGLPRYVEEDPPNVYIDNFFGRSALDHDSARLVARVSTEIARAQKAPHLSILADNPYRVAFVPIPFSAPMLTAYSEILGGEETRIFVGSSHALFRELLDAAELFQIPLQDGILSDEVAARINEYQPLRNGEVVDPNLDLRTTWLLLHEGSRLSVQHNIALSLAG